MTKLKCLAKFCALPTSCRAPLLPVSASADMRFVRTRIHSGFPIARIPRSRAFSRLLEEEDSSAAPSGIVVSAEREAGSKPASGGWAIPVPE
jgi:hypothetical protein